MLKTSTLSPDTLNLLKSLSNELDSFYLAGDTALAMYYQHRTSVDLDFFSEDYFDNFQLSHQLKTKGFLLENIRLFRGTLECQINNVKVSFFEYPYKIITNFSYFNSLKIASVLDIAAMKLSAIAGRAEKKDYYDIVEILKRNDFIVIIDAFQKKYGKEVDLYHVIKALCYFEDVENSPEPLNAKLTWNQVKAYLIKNCKTFFKLLEDYFKGE
ncbi:nucleotidyl transferase AbiEii/AbiGii toxin family protein [Kosmotoga sp. DU53]|uniref:nucleotidyl transferase AbiEii/AbiGii toxin family protein n=1 Tax=Kosmotoga sp. DU53 TaxID=1310160 RepID=UPI0007C45423|nr:nucleotidyl transferase AbiEii/AbiGii toxin family protein [Kosmotoga sp. DU53]OAA19111.1 hypothetical protein DU53_10820 [Kosmotoga sp. DU53]